MQSVDEIASIAGFGLGLQGVQQTIHLPLCIFDLGSGCSRAQEQELGSNKVSLKIYIAIYLGALLAIPSEGFVVFCLQQVCVYDLNVTCIIKFKQGCLSPPENVGFLEYSPQEKPNAGFKETYEFEPKLVKYLNNIFRKHTFSS